MRGCRSLLTDEGDIELDPSSAGARRVVRVQDRSGAATAAVATRSFAQAAGFDARAQGELATIAAELASNIARHAGQGTIELMFRCVGDLSGMIVRACDDGTFVGDPKQAVVDGYSRGRMRVAGEGMTPKDGLGVGLGTVGRMSDEFRISLQSPRGTIVQAAKYLAAAARR